MGSIFGGLKIVFFRASCFGFRVKGVSPLLLPLVSLNYIKNLLWNDFFFAFFSFRSSSRHEKRCQILQTLLWVFQYSRNIQWTCLVSSLTDPSSKQVLCIRQNHMDIILFSKLKIDLFFHYLGLNRFIFPLSKTFKVENRLFFHYLGHLIP